MSFQWLQMRISEEIDRRKREAGILERLPRAVDELHQALQLCVESYQKAFGEQSADIQLQPFRILIVVRVEQDGQWTETARVQIVATSEVPGFQIDQGTTGDPLIIEVGMLPGDRLYYRDRAKDQYVTMEELTKRTIDRAFFPNLREER